MFNKLRSVLKSFFRRIRKSVKNTHTNIKRTAKRACQRISKSPVAAFAVGAAVTAAATVVAYATGSVKLVKSVLSSGVMLTSGLTCMAWRKKKHEKDCNELATHCDELYASDMANAID